VYRNAIKSIATRSISCGISRQGCIWVGLAQESLIQSSAVFRHIDLVNPQLVYIPLGV
jgi:hypothetical protein